MTKLIADFRFLIVEDHSFQRRATRQLLEDLGACRVLEAADGREALRFLNRDKALIDIIISDLDMPGMDGMEFMRHAAETESQASFILASALDRGLIGSVETMAAAYGVKLLGAIQKPVTALALDEAIRRHSSAQVGVAIKKVIEPIFAVEEIIEGVQNHEFEPYLQPKVEFSTGAIKGVEALARWRHPTLGIVSPSTFIKPLEDSGHIDILTLSMLEMAAASCRRWCKSGLDATVSVNISLKSLSDVRFADRVTALVLAQNLEPKHMVLEVTESAATSDVGSALENLSRLRMRGFGLSIDDYGTGYSSMQQLSRIAFTELKIDQSFVRNAARQDASRVILESSIETARRLGMVAVAEGVETQSEWDLLKSLSCDLGQGYFVAAPMEISAFTKWVKTRRPLH